MAVVRIRVTGEDASEVATILERLLGDICQPGLSVLDDDEEADLSCEVRAPAGGLAEIQRLAAAVLGSRLKAERFLRKPHPQLDMRRSVDVIRDGEAGAEAVRQILGRLLSGAVV